MHYLLACLDETLRMISTNSTGLPRYSPGAVVDAHSEFSCHSHLRLSFQVTVWTCGRTRARTGPFRLPDQLRPSHDSWFGLFQCNERHHVQAEDRNDRLERMWLY